MKRVFAVLLVAALAVGAFFLGRITSPKETSQVFYGVITSKTGSHLVVEGIPENDINHRGSFQFTLDDSVTLWWCYTEISLEDLDVGDRICVKYTGPVLEISPAILEHVLEIQLLDDER